MYLQQGQFLEAAQHFEQAIEIADDIGLVQYQHDALGTLARTDLFRDQLDESRKMAEPPDNMMSL